MRVKDLIWLGQRLAEAGQLDVQGLAPGVPTAELLVMYELLEEGPSSITELAERTGYAQSRVSAAVAGLRDREWIGTRRDPADGRRTIAYVPADSGRRASRTRARDAGKEVLGPLLADLPRKRREAIIGALEELHDLLRRQEGGDTLPQGSTEENRRLLRRR
jgi:MarR family transcriptional regulator, 2-MHQ and catechol-resistance regulon repressor